MANFHKVRLVLACRLDALANIGAKVFYLHSAVLWARKVVIENLLLSGCPAGFEVLKSKHFANKAPPQASSPGNLISSFTAVSHSDIRKNSSDTLRFSCSAGAVVPQVQVRATSPRKWCRTSARITT